MTLREALAGYGVDPDAEVTFIECHREKVEVPPEGGFRQWEPVPWRYVTISVRVKDRDPS